MDDCFLALSLSLYFSLHSWLSGVTPRKMRADWCRRGNEWPLICMLIVRWLLGDCFGAGSMLRGTSEWHPITANTPTAMARMTVYVIMFWKIMSVPVEFSAVNATSNTNELLMTLMFFTLHWKRNAINCQTGIKELIRMSENKLVHMSWKCFTWEFQHRFSVSRQVIQSWLLKALSDTRLYQSGSQTIQNQI